MASLRAGDCSIPFTLPLGADGFVVVQENLLSLKFNFCLGSMYVEQKSKVDSDSFWSLSAGSYKVIGLSKLDMDASTMLLTNKSIKPIPQIHSLRKVKLEVDDVVVLSDSDEDNIQVVDIAGTSSYPFQSPCSFTSTSSVQPLHGSDPSPHIHSQKPHVHPTSSISNVHILEALKITKCRRRSKSDLTNIDFDNIVIEDVKYLPSSFNGDVFFILPPIKTGIPDAYGKAMDGMDKIYDGHAWCRTKTTNIQNEFGLTFRRSSCVGHLQCPNDSCEYLSRNGGVRNSTEWIGITPTPFMVGTVPPEKSKVQCKVCHAAPTCLDVCYAKIIYVHSQSSNMSRGCIHLEVQNHPVSIGVCCESLDMAYQCVANEVAKSPIAKNSAIVMAASKQFLADYILKSPFPGEKNHLHGASLEVVMDKFSTLASPNCRNFVAGSKRFIRSGMGSLDSIMALKNHSGFKYVHDSRFPGQSKDKVFVFKMSVDLAGSGVDLVKRMQCGGDMENSWIMFDHVKRLQDWTTMACHVYDSKHCKVLTIACCDMQSEDARAQTIFWENLNAVMLENGVPNVNFKGFMADSAQANWIAVRKICGDGDTSVPLEGRERTCLFHWSANLDKITQKHIRPSLQHEHKQLCKDYKDAKSLEDVDIKYHVIRAWWLSSGATTEEGMYSLSEWLGFWHYRYRQWGGHMLIVSFFQYTNVFPLLLMKLLCRFIF
jgi:hypothetical protein